MSYPIRIKERLHSFRFAWNGLRVLIKTQHNAWIHLLATIAVLVLATWCDVSKTEWCLLALAIGQVWIAEALNTAIEYLADAVTLEQNPLIGKAKDIAAGAVLLAAACSCVIGLIVFLPFQ